MTKARDLANFVSTGNPLADGTLSVADISDLTASAAELNELGDFAGTFTLPVSDGTNGQFLQTNGSGTLTFQSVEAFNTQTASTSSTAQTTIATYAISSFDGVKATIVVDDSTAGERTVTEIIITHDGTTAVATEYAIVNTDTTRATFDVDISGGNIRIRATPVSSNSMSFTVKAITL